MDDMQDIPAELITDIHEYYHDLQYFVGALAQLSVVNQAQEGDVELLRKRLSDINGFSVIMSAKTNFLKYLTTDAGDRAVKRVISGARQLAKSRGQWLKIGLKGESFSAITGPNVFEFIPYLILENAIKYSPNHGEITVSIDEHADAIVCRVESLGPEIELDEEARIFDKGFRGHNAN
jgi:signal transduction histidine kinase